MEASKAPEGRKQRKRAPQPQPMQIGDSKQKWACEMLCSSLPEELNKSHQVQVKSTPMQPASTSCPSSWKGHIPMSKLFLGCRSCSAFGWIGAMQMLDVLRRNDWQIHLRPTHTFCAHISQNQSGSGRKSCGL